MAKESRIDRMAKKPEEHEKQCAAERKDSLPKAAEIGNRPTYSVQEFADCAHSLFGTRPECVMAALKSADISECTVSEAKKTVKDFLNREVG